MIVREINNGLRTCNINDVADTDYHIVAHCVEDVAALAKCGMTFADNLICMTVEKLVAGQHAWRASIYRNH